MATKIRSTGFGDWWTGPSSSVPGAVGDTEEIADPYKQEPRVASCVDMLTMAWSLATPRLWDRDPDDPDAQEVTDGPLAELLLRKPASHFDATRLRIFDAMFISLVGESFWFLRDGNGNPVRTYGDGSDALIDLPEEIIPVRGDLVGSKLHPITNKPWKWTVSIGRGKRFEWDAGAVLQKMEMPDPNTTGRPHRGIGRLAKAFGPGAENYLARRYQSFLLANAGDPAGFFTTDQYLMPQQVEEMQEHLDDEVNNPESVGKWRIASGGLKPHPTSRSPKDMEFPSLRKANQDEISAVFATPGAILGEDTSNFATWAGMLKIWSANRVQPALRGDAAAINSLIARLRDPALRETRFRYDTEYFEQLFADPDQQTDRTVKQVGIGVPLNDAMSLAGIKTDPIEGGDVPMVAAGRTPLLAAQLHGQARAAHAAIAARLDPKQAWELAGVPGAKVVDEPEPAPAADPSEKPAKEPEPAEEETADDDAAPAAEDEEKSLARAATVPAVTRATAPVRTDAQEAYYQGTERRLRPFRAKMDRAIKRVFSQMKRAQLKALEQFAEEGKVDRAAAFDFPKSMARIPDGEGPQIVREPVSRPRLSQCELDTLATAALEDWREDRAMAPDDERRRLVVGDCDPIELQAPYRARQERWLRAHPALKEHSLADMADFAVMQRITLTDDELEQLIVLNDHRWVEALSGRIIPITSQVYTLFGTDISSLFGLGFVDATNPAVLQAIESHAVQVVEGSTTVLAKRMRSDLITLLADTNATIGGEGGLQAIIKESLGELKASTTRAFKDHFARALAIARTETGRAANVARFNALMGAIEEGVIEEIEWITSGQPEEPKGPTRSAHFAMNGVKVRPPDKFLVGANSYPMKHPHDDSAPAALVVNCKCTLAGVVEDDDDDE